jgi:hypothetical protein
MITNLHVYNYRDPVTDKYYRYDNRFFLQQLTCVLLSRPSLTRVLRISGPIHFVSNDNLQVYYYRGPVSHKYYAYQRPVFFSKECDPVS